VLDEADRMLDMGFIHDIRRIIGALPKKRQNLMFSATFSDDIRKLAHGILHNPATVEVAPRNATVDLIEQRVHPVDKSRKAALLSHLVREGNWQPSAGYDQTNILMDLPRPPTAIFCSNDRMAVGCYEALKERGLSIPDDESVIGYDDEEVARHLSPPLTTLVLPHREMGRWVVERGFTPFSSRREKHPITKLECPLIERSSIAGPKRAANVMPIPKVQQQAG